MTNKKVVNTNYAGAKGEKIDFARFVEIAKETIKDYLPDEYENAIVDVYPCNRLNKSYLGMIVKTQKNAVSPTLNLNMFYDALQRFHYDLEKIMKKNGGGCTDPSNGSRHGAFQGLWKSERTSVHPCIQCRQKSGDIVECSPYAGRRSGNHLSYFTRLRKEWHFFCNCR